VLLKNAENLLPLDKTAIKSVAVIGPRAGEVLLDWYSGTPPYAVTPLDGITAKVAPGVAIAYAADNENGEAARIAAAADVAIVCVGNNPIGVPGGEWERVSAPSEGREAVDRQSIHLEQEELIQQVMAANPKTVVVLICSFPYAINWTQENVPAILHMTHGSQELGNALADVLFGDYSPAGRLVQTWPTSLEQLPPMMDYNIRDGRTYMYFRDEPLYSFGHGLSYTTFAYSNLKASADSLSADDEITVSVDVQNSGAIAGEEVVQLYVKHLESSVVRPSQELRGFERVALQPGERKSIEFPLPAGRLASWDESRERFVVEVGKIELRIGASSADIRASKVIAVTP
jgi:beta-glucosidase